MADEVMTKERLSSYSSLRFEIENQLERLARLKNAEQIPAIQQGDGSKSTGAAGSRMERAVLKRMEYEERILPQIEAARAEMRAIEAAVDAVSDPMEREVLRLRYLDSRYSRPMPWKEVALKLFGDDDDNDDDKHQLATFRLHGRALQCLKNRGD